jgi:hypothetical protein
VWLLLPLQQQSLETHHSQSNLHTKAGYQTLQMKARNRKQQLCKRAGIHAYVYTASEHPLQQPGEKCQSWHPDVL